jgi:hypothetical protein
MAQIFLFSLFACQIPTKEDIDKRTYDDMVKNVEIFSPRENVECYVLKEIGPTRPRVMSCVVLPQSVNP